MSTTLQIAGAVAITAGAALMFPAAGLIVGGAFMVVIGFALGR